MLVSRSLGAWGTVVLAGAGTNIAAEYSARSRDYGNLMFTADFATLAANPHLFRKLAYNAEKDFVPIGLLARFPLFLVVGNPLPVPAGQLPAFRDMRCAGRRLK